MGAFLTDHFEAAWKKLGTFLIVRTANGERKVGGNVVAYFCTPDLRILHAVWGPESPGAFLAQAKWAVELAGRLRTVPERDRAAVALDAHETNPYRTSKGMWTYEGFKHYDRYNGLVKRALAPLDRTTSAALFLDLVDEEASDGPVRIRDWGRLLPDRAIPSCPPRP